MSCIKIEDGIVCIGDDSFHCPHCGKVYNDGILFGINNCNAEFQVILQEIYTEFNNLKRINKSDMVKILTKHCSKELGEDINPFLEDVSE